VVQDQLAAQVTQTGVQRDQFADPCGRQKVHLRQVQHQPVRAGPGREGHKVILGRETTHSWGVRRQAGEIRA
jgi:hypothetical protein